MPVFFHPQTRSSPCFWRSGRNLIYNAAPNETIGIGKDGYDLQNIKGLANANPGLLKLGGKAPWPTVTLLK